MATIKWEGVPEWLIQSINPQYYNTIMISIAFLLWLLIFAVSLKGIDCSHTIAALAYITLCSACGTLLVVALPTSYLKSSDLRVDFLFVFAFALIAALNWLKEIRRRQRKGDNKKKESI